MPTNRRDGKRAVACRHARETAPQAEAAVVDCRGAHRMAVAANDRRSNGQRHARKPFVCEGDAAPHAKRTDYRESFFSSSRT